MSFLKPDFVHLCYLSSSLFIPRNWWLQDFHCEVYSYRGQWRHETLICTLGSGYLCLVCCHLISLCSYSDSAFDPKGIVYVLISLLEVFSSRLIQDPYLLYILRYAYRILNRCGCEWDLSRCTEFSVKWAVPSFLGSPCDSLPQFSWRCCPWRS